ncbi:MAG: spore maturation protein A [Ruminococcus sp.]|jgi:spore maturation protein A|nr:spore maturation protein A [Ruminococcus sp.]
MMKWVFGLMLLLSVIFGLVTGNAAPLTESALNSCVEAVELFLYLIGGMCMWGGLMRIAEKAGLTTALAKIFRPLFKFLFPGLDPSSKAYGLICMNVAANVLGLGNAATPIGLNAMHELEIEGQKRGLDGTVASRHMIVFIVLNTASITLIPQTAATLRLKHGSLSPFDIFPAVIVTSVIALAAGLLVALIFNAADKRKAGA